MSKPKSTMSDAPETVSNDKGDTLPAPENHAEAVAQWVWGFGPNEFPVDPDPLPIDE